MANVTKESSSNGGNIFTIIAIVGCLLIGFLIRNFILGDPSNFEGGDPANHPLPGNYLGMVYKGGNVVPILMGLLLMVIVFSIERFFVITKAAGKGNLDKFMENVQARVKEGDIDGAIEACDKQQGSVANAIKSALIKYQEVKRE